MLIKNDLFEASYPETMVRFSITNANCYNKNFVLRIANVYSAIEKNEFFTFSNGSTREHNLRIQPKNRIQKF